jgi:hypothetical protein
MRALACSVLFTEFCKGCKAPNREDRVTLAGLVYLGHEVLQQQSDW